MSRASTSWVARLARRLLAVLLAGALGLAGAQAAPHVQFKGTMTRVTFTGNQRKETRWKLEYRVPPMSGVRRVGRDEASVFVLTELSARRVETYTVKSGYMTTSMAVYLARQGNTAITVVFPALPRFGVQGGSANTRAVVLFDNDPVSTHLEGTWSIEPPRPTH